MKKAAIIYNSRTGITKKYAEQIKELPQPVKRYFKYALRVGQPYLSHLRLKHMGQFKTGQGKDWVNIKGNNTLRLS